jgi:Asp-tRNA(Asn)/Glu-tRNA(Gln) amidotransferase A subunit family amidase
MELWQLDATELARLIRVGQASSREAVAACLARMDAVNGKLNAVVRRLDKETLVAADAADAARAQGNALGPLHGVPVTIKVNTDQKGHPTDNGVVAFRDLIAPDDAPVVVNLRAAGAVVIGRQASRSTAMPPQGPRSANGLRCTRQQTRSQHSTHWPGAICCYGAGSNSSMTTRSLCCQRTAICRRPGVRIRRARVSNASCRRCASA